MLQQSDAKAFEELYGRYWFRIFRYAFTKVHQQEVAEDICHDVFLSLWQRRGQVQIQNAEAYLIQAAKFSVIAFYRAKQSDEKHLPVYAGSVPGTHNETEYQLFFRSLEQAWQEALQDLPQKTRDVFQASRIEQLSNREIATRLGLTEKAVEYHITKALREIHLRLKDFFVLLLLVKIIFKNL